MFLQNISGFMVGRDYEAGGIAERGTKMVTAVAFYRVPKLTVVIGGSSARQLRHVRPGLPRPLPLDVAQRPDLGHGRRTGRSVLATVADREGRSGARKRKTPSRNPVRDQYETQGNPYYATARLWDDGVIDPIDTRRVLGLGVAAAGYAPMAASALRRVPNE